MSDENEETMYYRLTPKGAMAVTFIQELGLDINQATDLARKVEDAIFMQGYVYYHESQVRLVSQDPEDQGE